MWIWRRMERISWMRKVNEYKQILNAIWQWKQSWNLVRSRFET